jgi:hypothetical protein
MRELTGFVVLTVASAVIACAAQAQSTSPATQAVSAKAQATSPASQSASAAPQKDEATPHGYDLVLVHGKRLFCRMQPVTGTRFRQKVCLTKAQLQAEQDNTQRFIQNVQRMGAVGTQGTYMQGGMTAH